MCESWFKAFREYDWEVDLSNFKHSSEYPGYFISEVTPENTHLLEDKFRKAVEENGSYVVAGEVCFWINYGSYQARNRVTKELLDLLSVDKNWDGFVYQVKQTSKNPSYDNFVGLKKSCNQPKGFTIPIAFLAFYNPSEYPLINKHIANWWELNKDRFGFNSSPKFSQRKDDGWIQSYTESQVSQNWEAYLSWTEFCRDYAKRLSEECDGEWRPRDVEMAVRAAQKKGNRLNEL